MVDGFDITDKTARLLLPLLERIQKLEFTRCKLGKGFLKNLPLWSPDLRELEYSFCTLLRKECIRQRFPKLESVGFRFVPDVRNSDMEEYLNQNQQLQIIAIFHCKKQGKNKDERKHPKFWLAA